MLVIHGGKFSIKRQSLECMKENFLLRQTRGGVGLTGAGRGGAGQDGVESFLTVFIGVADLFDIHTSLSC